MQRKLSTLKALFLLVALLGFFLFFYFISFFIFFFGLCHLHDHILCKWRRREKDSDGGQGAGREGYGRWPAVLSGVGNKFLIRIALITTILSAADTTESPGHTQMQRYTDTAWGCWRCFCCCCHIGNGRYRYPRASGKDITEPRRRDESLARQAYKSYTIHRTSTHNRHPSTK